MKKLLSSLVIAILAVSMFAGSCFAQAPKSARKGKAPQMRMERSESLDLQLSETQKEKINKLRRNYEKDLIDIRFDQKEAKENLNKLWKERPLNAKAIDNASKESNAVRIRSIEHREKFQKEFNAILTADQLKKIENFKKERKDKKCEKCEKCEKCRVIKVAR